MAKNPRFKRPESEHPQPQYDQQYDVDEGVQFELVHWGWIALMMALEGVCLMAFLEWNEFTNFTFFATNAHPTIYGMCVLGFWVFLFMNFVLALIVFGSTCNRLNKVEMSKWMGQTMFLGVPSVILLKEKLE